jgi:hypothetical protein
LPSVIDIQPIRAVWIEPWSVTAVVVLPDPKTVTVPVDVIGPPVAIPEVEILVTLPVPAFIHLTPVADSGGLIGPEQLRTCPLVPTSPKLSLNVPSIYTFDIVVVPVNEAFNCGAKLAATYAVVAIGTPRIVGVPVKLGPVPYIVGVLIPVTDNKPSPRKAATG